MVDTLFHGLDKSYVYHKYLSISSLVLIWIHNFTLDLGRVAPINGAPRPGGGIPVGMGSAFFNLHMLGRDFASLSLYSFTALLLFAYFVKKLEYQKWKLVHMLMIVPYAFGVFHYYSNSDYAVLSFQPYSIWMNLLNIVGILSSLYSLLLYEQLAFRFQYKVTTVKLIAKNTLEITGSSLGKEIRYKPGQFAFIKFQDKTKAFPSHPFSISQAPITGQIQF